MCKGNYAPSLESRIRSYSWVLNSSLSFGHQQWDVIGVPPSTAKVNLSPEDMDALGLAEGERVRVSSRRGSVEAPAHLDETLRAGLAFMTLHFPEQVETNVLTLDAWDPKSGTAEFKATAIRIQKIQEN